MKAIFIMKGSGWRAVMGERDWVEGYWLTPPRQTLHLVSQGCCHRDDPAIIEARSGSACCFRATCGPCLLFSVRHTDAAKGTQGLTHTHTNFALAYKWLLCHYHAQGLQGRLSSYFEPHKWSASLTVTKQQSPGEVSDFQTPQLCIDEICKANVMNHNEDPPLFFHILPTLWMKTWNLRLHQQQGWILQRRR